MGKDRLRPLGLSEAQSTPGARMSPCNTCDLEPASCGKQRLVVNDSIPDTLILCGAGRGPVRRLEKPLRLDRIRIRTDNNLHGELEAGTKAPATAEAAL